MSTSGDNFIPPNIQQKIENATDRLERAYKNIASKDGKYQWSIDRSLSIVEKQIQEIRTACPQAKGDPSFSLLMRKLTAIRSSIQRVGPLQNPKAATVFDRIFHRTFESTLIIVDRILDQNAAPSEFVQQYKTTAQLARITISKTDDPICQILESSEFSGKSKLLLLDLIKPTLRLINGNQTSYNKLCEKVRKDSSMDINALIQILRNFEPLHFT